MFAVGTPSTVFKSGYQRHDSPPRYTVPEQQQNRFFPTKLTKKEALQNSIAQLHPLAMEFDLIRLGPDGDGGYLVPDDLQGNQCHFAGVGNTPRDGIHLFSQGPVHPHRLRSKLPPPTGPRQHRQCAVATSSGLVCAVSLTRMVAGNPRRQKIDSRPRKIHDQVIAAGFISGLVRCAGERGYPVEICGRPCGSAG